MRQSKTIDLKTILYRLMISCGLAFTFFQSTYSIIAVEWNTSQQQLMSNQTVRGFVTFKEGFRLPLAGAATLDIFGTVQGEIDLNGGILALENDLHCGSQMYFRGSGLLQGNGHAIALTDRLPLDSNQTISFAGHTVIDGGGNELLCSPHTKLVVEDGARLTLKNITLTNIERDNIILKTMTSELELHNVHICLSGDSFFRAGKIIVNGSVEISGPHVLSWEEDSSVFIKSHSCLYFDIGSVFKYGPFTESAHQKRYMTLEDETSVFYCNGCTLDVAPPGMQLTRGSLIFDNKVFIDNKSNTDPKMSFEWGDGTPEHDVHVRLLAGARVEVDGYVFHRLSASS